MSQEEYTAKFQPALNKLDAILGGLEWDLHKLQLQPYHYRFSCEGATAQTTFLNFLTRQAMRHPHRTENAHIWERSEFLARSLCGQWILGRGWQKHEAERRVKLILEEIVHQAARLVEEAFEVKEWSVWDGGVEQRYATHRCEYDEHDGYSTYLTLDETDVPWKGQKGEVQCLPEVDMAEASDEWLEAVGLSK
ncbi:hypothetical protein KC344_g5033 [Hortaea werneckii]|nr:hypothetical protein KC344_g5033 [Hortaea werneckii]